MEIEKIPAVKAKAGSYSVYVGSAPLKTLAGISFADQFNMESNEGVQRPLDQKHAREFRTYISGERATAPPLIFSLRCEASYENGHLSLKKTADAMAQLDAQHRMAFTKDLSVQLPFVIYHGLTREEEIEIFATINDKHKGMTKSLVDAHRFTLSKDKAQDREAHLAIGMKLNEDADSPWTSAVNTGGISKTTPGTKRKINLRTFQQAIQTLISGPRCQSLSFDEKYELVRNYWTAVQDLFPEEWASNRKYLLLKGIGIHAISAVGRDVIEECLVKQDTSVATMVHQLRKLEGFDWSNKTCPFANFGGQKGVKAAATVLNRIVFGTSQIADIDQLLQQYATNQ